MTTNNAPDMVTIPTIAYVNLQEDQRFLNALRAAGVDNWNGYDTACDIYAEDEQGVLQ